VTEKGRDVAIARSDEEVAKGAVSLARSPWLPSLDLYGRETWLRYLPEVKVPAGSFPTSQTGSRPTASRPLRSFTTSARPPLQSAPQIRLKAARSEPSDRNRCGLEFIVSYFDLLEAEELLKVAQEEVTRYEAHRKDAAARHKAGVVPATKCSRPTPQIRCSAVSRRCFDCQQDVGLEHFVAGDHAGLVAGGTRPYGGPHSA